jgi:hypothetical protein
MAEAFPLVINDQINIFNNPPSGYDTNPGQPITTDTIDPEDAGRPWSY